MSGNFDKSNDNYVEEISELSNSEQADTIASYFASTRNEYEKVELSQFSEYLNDFEKDSYVENLVTPQEIENVIKTLNKNSSCLLGDIPMKIIATFSEYLSNPLSNLLNSMFELGEYPNLWKRELITPVPNISPAPIIDKLCPISGI